MSRQVVVAGLYGMSLLLHMDEFPKAGETVAGTLLSVEPGGKGFNQAVSAARNGVDTIFLTAVGGDDFGQNLEADCKAYGFSSKGSVVLNESKTAAAAVMSDAAAESRVVVAQGACADVRPEQFDCSALPLSGILLLQNELPESVNLALAKASKEQGGTVILNPAPARPLEPSLLNYLDYLVPNWGEALSLAGLSAEATPQQVGEKLHAMGVPNLLITLGADGVWTSFAQQPPELIAAARVKAVDSTGAGDTFCGAFAARLAKGDCPVEATKYANAASGLSVTRKGVMQAIPFEQEIDTFRTKHQN